MSVRHSSNGAVYIDHGDASSLFPVEELSADVHQYRDAEIRLQSVESEKVVVVSPTGLASSYFLTQHPLTAIEIESLPDEVRAPTKHDAEIELTQFDLIQIGQGPTNIRNMSLAEFN